MRGRKVDLSIVGQSFNNWTIINFIETKGSPVKAYFNARCNCGTERIVCGYDIKRGKSKSCGLCKDVKIGDIFSDLTIVSFNEKLDTNRSKLVDCKCKCGKFVTIRQSHLKDGSTKSCGCSKKCKIQIGDKFGRLIVLEREWSDYDGRSRYLCECECGNLSSVLAQALTGNLTKSCGCLGREKRLIGIKKRWNEYVVDIKKKKSVMVSRQFLSYHINKSIRIRDKYICQLCDKNNGHIVHHIKPFSEYEELKFENKNLITLCEICHNKAHKNNWKLIDYDIQNKLLDKIAQIYK